MLIGVLTVSSINKKAGPGIDPNVKKEATPEKTPEPTAMPKPEIPATEPVANAQTPGCVYFYKTNKDYFKYVAGMANNRTGTYKLMAWPLNLDDKEVAGDYILGGGGCISSADDLNLVILNITKFKLNKALGYPGCAALQKETYPDCFGQIIKQGTPEYDACKEILANESNSETSICPELPEIDVNSILDNDPLIEFYVCKQADVPGSVEEVNAFINEEKLSEMCTQLI